MSRWYRAYEGTVTDPKFGEASLIAECSRAVAIAAWHAILENAAAINDGGRYDTTARRIAVILCEPPALITSVLDAFSELGLITAGTVAAWGRRQYESDTSTERSRRSRAKKRERNDDATLQGRRATPPDTDADSEEPEATASGPAAPVETGAAPAIDFCKAVFDSGRAILTVSGLDARKAGSLIGRWRQSLGDAEILTLIRQAEADAVSDPAAWLTAAVETRNGKPRPHRGQSDRPIDGFTSALRRASANLEAGNLG